MPSNKSPVEFTRQEVQDKIPVWELIRAVVEGELKVKSLGEKVLPMPNPTDKSPDNQSRYVAYTTRAVFYNVTGRTLEGLTGYVFIKDPTLNLPTELKALETNVDGNGVTLIQQAKETLSNLLALGRGGLLADYPEVNQATSVQDQVNGRITSTVIFYRPESIINWKTAVIGAQSVLTLLVLKETYLEESSNGFESCLRTQYRVLKLTPEGVLGEVHRKAEESEDYAIVKAYSLRGKNGQPLKEIPFVFLGARNNDETVDSPPLFDLAMLNLAHFRNSADHEESCFIVGQPTPWISGLTEAWVKEVLKGQVQIGSRAVLPLPQGGQAGLLQADANTMPFEAMKHKELQMVALGAKLVEQKQVQRTATEASMDRSSEVSILVSAANNVFAGYRRVLEMASQFAGGSGGKIEFELSEPLNQETITGEQATAIMSLFMGGLIDFEEARYSLKKTGLAWKKDDVVEQNATDAGLPQTQPPPSGNN